MKPVIIGQQPNSCEDEGTTLPIRPGSSGQFLTELAGGSLDGFDLINVSPFHDPDGFSPLYHRCSAKNMAPLLKGRKVIFLGPAVANAFEIRRSEYNWCSWYEMEFQWAVIPHPSGLNRLYNDPEIRERVLYFLRIES